jgi:hypothetical protein
MTLTTGACTSSSLLSSRAKRGICSSVFSPQPSAKSCHAGFRPLDQCYLLCPRPGFDLLLSGNRIAYVPERFVIHQPVDAVTLRESLDLAAFVFQCSAENVIRNSGVQIQRPARHDVHVIAPVSSQLQIPRFARDDNKKTPELPMNSCLRSRFRKNQQSWKTLSTMSATARHGSRGCVRHRP